MSTPGWDLITQRTIEHVEALAVVKRFGGRAVGATSRDDSGFPAFEIGASPRIEVGLWVGENAVSGMKENLHMSEPPRVEAFLGGPLGSFLMFTARSTEDSSLELLGKPFTAGPQPQRAGPCDPGGLVADLSA